MPLSTSISCDEVNGKLHQSNTGRATDGPDPLGMKVCVTHQPGNHEMLVEGRKKREWGLEEGSYTYELRPCDQLQKQGL